MNYLYAEFIGKINILLFTVYCLLSIDVMNFVALNEPIYFFKFYFNPKAALPQRFSGVKIMKIRSIEILTIGPL
jgi:hypothetical protein